MLQKYKYIFGIVCNIFSDSLSKQDGRNVGRENFKVYEGFSSLFAIRMFGNFT